MKLQALRPISPPRQQGFALLYVVFMTSFITLLLGTSVTYTTQSMASGRHEMTQDLQARNVARAGLQAANLWLAQQPVQPVRQLPDSGVGAWPDQAFLPRYSADPLASQTDNETLGLVRDIPISLDQRLWGHFVVRRQVANNEPDAGGDAAKTDQLAAHDISHLRTSQGKGSGAIWQVTSVGYVYTRNDMQRGQDGVFQVAFDQAPNQVLDKAAVQVELQRVAINLPQVAVAYDRGALALGAGARVSNPAGAGIAYAPGATPPSGVTAGNVQGAPQSTQDPTLDLSPEAIFALSPVELMGLADQTVADASELRLPLPSYGIICVKGDASFDAGRPLVGGGILYVGGDLTLAEGGFSRFSGVVYAGGNLRVEGTNLISGTVVVRGSATIDAASDAAAVEYNPAIVQTVRMRLGNYRPNNLTFKLVPIA